MFRCSFARAAILKDIVAVLKESVRDIRFVISPEDLRVLTTDKTEVALFKLSLPPSCFTEYVVSAEQSVIGMKAADLSKTLSCILDNETLTMNYDGTSSKMYFCSTSPQIKTYDRSSSFELKLIDIPPLDLIISENPTHEAVCCLKAKQFQVDCENLESFHTSLNLTASPIAVILETISGGRMVCPTDSVLLAEGLNSLTCTYDLKYINKFTKAVNLCSTVQIGFSNKGLLYLSYAVEGGGYLSLILAPKMDVK